MSAPEDVPVTSLQRLLRIRAEASEQLGTTSHWVLGALVAANGAAAIALPGVVENLSHPAIWGVLFTAGVVLAILSGMAIEVMEYLRLRELNRLEAHLSGLEPEWPADAATKLDQADSLGWAPPICGFLSTLAFLIGALGFGVDAAYPDPHNEQRCLAIQCDMLRARPRKEDGHDLFQALGCRPQGEGSVYVPPTAAELRSAGHK